MGSMVMPFVSTLVPDSYTSMLIQGRKAAVDRLAVYQNWHAGIYRLTFPAKIAVEVADLGIKTNLCKPIIDALCTKLNIKSVTTDEKRQDVLDTEYKYNQMQLQTTSIIHETAVCGDAYGLVWPEYGKGHVRGRHAFVRLLRSEDVDLQYDEEDLLRPTRCVRKWNKTGLDGKLMIRRDTMTPESILREFSSGRDEGGIWLPFTADGLDAEVKNDMREVPVVHFRIEEDLRNRPFGLSQLENAIPICMDINVLVKDVMLRAYYNGGMQRVITGANKKAYEAASPEGLDMSPWSVHWFDNPAATETTLKGDDLSSLSALIDKRVKHLAITTRTPLQYLEAGAQFASGVALEKLDEQLKDKVDEAQTMMGASFQRLFALMTRAADESTIDPDITVEWERPYAVDTSSQDMDEYKAGLITAKKYHMRRGMDEKQAQLLVDELAKEQTTRTMSLFGAPNAG